MAKDHYVARTYLKHFGDPKHGGMLHAYRKPDAKYFRCWPADVCHEWDGDLNPEFIAHRPELLGDFRKIFEPQWNAAVEKLQVGDISPTEKFAISGYMANLMTSTPAWRRVGVAMLDQGATRYLSIAKDMQKKAGTTIPDFPVDAIEALEAGKIVLKTNPEYIKALTTKQMVVHACLTYHQDWSVIHNETHNLFLTSDNPLAILEYDDDVGIPTRFLAITPRLCLSVKYDPNSGEITNGNLSDALRAPPKGSIRNVGITADGARKINRAIVKCAEDLVFSSSEGDGLSAFIAKCGRYRVVADYVEVTSADEPAVYQGAVIRVREPADSEAVAELNKSIVEKIEAYDATSLKKNKPR